MSIKRVDIKEFHEFGFLQEVNRQFFHPLGLALEVIIDEETGDESLGGVWDARDDPEGFLFTPEDLVDEVCVAKARRVEELHYTKACVRHERYGFVIQPIVS